LGIGPDLVRLGIKADQIARTHIDGAHGEAHRTRIDPIEIDKPLKGRAQLRGVVVARGAALPAGTNHGAIGRGVKNPDAPPNSAFAAFV
jgi:hypothetical protein